MQSLYKLNPIPAEIGAFSYLLILFCFFRDQLFLRQAEDMGLPAVFGQDRGDATGTMGYQQKVWELLDPSRRPGHSRGDATAAQYYHMMRIVLHVSHRDLTAFSGWRVSQLGQQETQGRLLAWVSANGDSAREAVLHAGILLHQCRSRSTSGYQEPAAIVLATLVLWVYNSSLSQRMTQGLECDSKLQRRVPAFRLDREMDQEEALDWIRNGNQQRPFVAGVGNIHAPGSFSKALQQAVNSLTSFKTWQVSQIFSATFQGMLASLGGNSVM